MKILFVVINSKLNTSEENIIELTDIATDRIKSFLGVLWNNIKMSNISIIRDQKKKKTFEKIMAGSVPNLRKTKNSKIQETQKIQAE